MPKPNLLFITPVVPRETGNGLAMRAYHCLEVLAEKYDIHALIVRLRPEREVKPGNLEFCRKVVCSRVNHRRHLPIFFRHLLYKTSPRLFLLLLKQPSESVYVSAQRINSAAADFLAVRFDLIHVFRFYMVPFARPFLAHRPETPYQIDLDDVESQTRSRISCLHQQNGEHRAARLLSLEASIYAAMEKTELCKADNVIVCSDKDKAFLAKATPCPRITVAPNVVKLPQTRGSLISDARFSFLFVGTFGYYPNVDGIIYFCNEVLPLIRAAEHPPFVVGIAGAGMPAELRHMLQEIPEVALLGFVEDLSVVYADSAAVIVPIRAGGGTRVKVLEAFSYEKPVVSTSLGVEGLRVRDGETVLIGDTPELFAQQCLRIMKNPELRIRLGQNALQLVSSEYHLENLRKVLLADRRS